MKNLLYIIFLILICSCATSEEKYILTRKDKELVRAVKMSNLIKIDKLIESGANVNARLNTGESVLMLAAGGAYSKIFRDEDGVTHISMQKIKDNYMITELLIKNKADVNFINKTGRTALIQAAIMGNLAIVKLLVNSGADTDVQDKSKTRAIDYASRLGHKNVVKYLSATGSR